MPWLLLAATALQLVWHLHNQVRLSSWLWDEKRLTPNLFVAGFIGSPEMNVIDGEIEGTDFRLGGQVISLDEAVLNRMHAKPQEAALGIRPQHMKLSAGNGLTARLRSAEFMGHEVYLHAMLEGKEITTVAGAAEYDALDRSDERIRLTPDLGHAHIFDRASGANVSLPLAG